MPIVRCKNDVSIKGSVKCCNNFLAILPASIINALKDNPNDKLTLRCHECPGETKWVSVYYSTETGFTWEICDDEINFDNEGEMYFDNVLNSKILRD